MRLVWIGRDHAELDAMRPYLPIADTSVFLTRATETPPTTVCDEQAAAAAQAVEQVLPGTGSSPAVGKSVGKGETAPGIFAFVGVASICLTQMAYYVCRGESSVYADYLNKGGEPTEAQYLLSRALPVMGRCVRLVFG